MSNVSYCPFIYEVYDPLYFMSAFFILSSLVLLSILPRTLLPRVVTAFFSH